MASRQGNTARFVKTSMVEELFELVSEEEYLEIVPVFDGTDYLNRVELSSLKKMISGKLWVDSRKFLNRQNKSIASGMLSLFGQTVGKSATDVKSDICDQLLDTDNRKLRSILRDSMKSAKHNYNEWIACLNTDKSGCDEFVLYLLCQTYKRHVVVILSSRLWCSFKSGTMSVFEQLNKADHVLVWLGEDKYGEVKPLHIKSGVGNVLEWQHLAETIQYLHEKRCNSKQQKRPDKSTNIKTQTESDVPISRPVNPRRGKRANSGNIDYKHYHSNGIRAAKNPRTDKTVPNVTGPSTTRLAAQLMINNQKAIKKEITTGVKHPVLVKPEPDIHLVYRKPKENVNLRYVHSDGRPCPKGASGVCRSKRSKHRAEDDMELPDLPEISPPPTQHVTQKSITERLDTIDVDTEAAIKMILSGYIRHPRSVTTSRTDQTDPPTTLSESPITLISPPAINRTKEMLCTPKKQSSKNLDDLLSTLNFDATQAVTQRVPQNNQVRSVVTDVSYTTTTNTNNDDTTTPSIDLTREENQNIKTDRSVVTVETGNLLDVNETNVTETVRSVTTAQVGVTHLSQSGPALMMPEREIRISVQEPVSTKHADAVPEYNSDELPDLVLPKTRSVITNHDRVMEQTPERTQLEITSQPSTTPRSVLSDPDDTEIETAHTLLSLGSMEHIDQAVDNETLLPVDKPRTEDFTQELASQKLERAAQAADDSDSDRTVVYGDDQPENSHKVDDQ